MCSNNSTCIHLFKEFMKSQELAEQTKDGLKRTTNSQNLAALGEEKPPEVVVGGKPPEDKPSESKSGVQGEDRIAIADKGDSSIVREENLHRIAFTNSPLHMSIVF